MPAPDWAQKMLCIIVSVSVVIILCQMQANSSGAEFLSTIKKYISKYMKKMNFVIACLCPSQNLKLGIFTGSRAVDAKKCTKKRDARAKLFCLVKLLLI